MALSKNIVTEHGFEIQNAYCRIESVTILKKSILIFCVDTYKDKTKQSVNSDNFSCAYDFSGANPIAQAYVYLKTLPEFAGATDC
jgi:hypothetical protein